MKYSVKIPARRVTSEGASTLEVELTVDDSDEDRDITVTIPPPDGTRRDAEQVTIANDDLRAVVTRLCPDEDGPAPGGVATGP